MDEPSPNGDLRREAFSDPLGTKATVAAALDNPDCRVREGETRPDLHEACAALDMVRLAALHQWCGMLMGDGFAAFESIERLLEWRLEEAAELAPSQESYYREIEDAYEDAAKRFHRYHMCSGLPPGALQPLHGH